MTMLTIRSFSSNEVKLSDNDVEVERAALRKIIASLSKVGNDVM